MNWKSILVAVVIVVILLAIGCSMIGDLYPAKVPRGLATYTDKDPNHLGWQCAGSLREILNDASLKHQLTQNDIEYAAKKDNLNYSAVATAGTTSLQIAIAEREAAFGTNGWLWPIISTLFGGTIGGIAVGTIVGKIKDNTNYTPAEVKILTEAAATSGKAPVIT